MGETAMIVLNNSNSYFASGLYKCFQAALLREGIDSYFFVPVNTKWAGSTADHRVKASLCFRNMDRYFYRYKQKKIYNEFETIIREIRPDILHAHFLFSSGFSCLRAKQKFGLKYIVAVRNTDVNAFFRYCFWLRKLGIEIMEESSAIIFLNEPYRRYVIDKYVPQRLKKAIDEKSIVIPNGIDQFWLNNSKQHQHPEGKTIRIVYAGGIDRNKNCVATVKACEQLIQKGYEIKYTLIGKIIDKTCFDKISGRSFIEYIPHMNKEELAKLYKEQDIFVMPSINETFGLVYAEAMSQGLPVIYSRGQGFDKQFEEGQVGYSVDSCNPEEIADKIEAVLEQYDEISARCTVLCRKFDWNEIVKQYISIYQRALDEQ